MKLLILTEGGDGVGIGHITRCHAIAQALQIVSGSCEIQSVIAGDRSLSKWIPAELNAVISDWRKSYAKFESLIRSADAVLIDSYHASIALLKRIAAWNSRLFFMDDYYRLDYPAGIVIVPAPYFDKSKRSKGGGAQWFAGSEFVVLRKAFWTKPKRLIRKTIKDVLVTLGGTAPLDKLGEITQALTGMGINVHAVVPGVGEIIPWNKDKARVYRKLNAEKMKALMLRCDLAVTAGGQTLYELASCGLPAIAFQMADNQSQNLKALRAIGSIVDAGSLFRSGISARLSRSIDKVSAIAMRKSMSRAGMKSISRAGGEKIARMICSVRRRDDFAIRNVRRSDSQTLFKWRNHPLTRSFSINQNLILIEDHQRWFDLKFKSKNTTIYIGYTFDDCLLGQARFEKMSPEKASIHFNLNPQRLGHGFGIPFLIRTTRTYMKKNRRVESIQVEILNGDKNTMRAFEAAGFVSEGLCFKNAMKLKIFSLRREHV